MHISTIIQLILAVILLWVTVATARLLRLFVRGGHSRRFFAWPRGVSCHGFGHRGISLLCRDTGDVDRLHNLLAVEYPDYEVIVVADSLRNSDSLQRIVAQYRMVAVDGRVSGREREPHLRRMFRSTSRCYRRLLLLDVATTEQRADLDVAFDAATYDYLLPLWSDERLQRGAIERLAAEVCTALPEGWGIISTCAGRPLRLISRRVAAEAGGVAAVLEGQCRPHYIYEPLLAEGPRPALRWRIVTVAVGVLIMVSVGAAAVGVAPIEMSMVALMLLSIVVAAYAAMVATSPKRYSAVVYVESLSLFCKNLLPRIWQIQK